MGTVTQKGYVEEDVVQERVDHLIEQRMPWLFVGLLGGIFVTFVVSQYEAILSSDIRVAFFIPLVVYLSSALGMQAETIYVRELSERKHFNFLKYIFKESIIGLGLGAISGLVLGVFAGWWLQSFGIGLAIFLTMLVNLTIAPVLAITVSGILYKRHSDPALGSGPLATVAQDLISLLVYLFIASIIIL